MRLQCTVLLASRTPVASSSAVTSVNRRPVKSSLALGSDPSDPKCYSIVHFTAANKCGTRYRLNGNIEQVFIKFHTEGKATIKFKTPPHDLLIQSDPVQLKSFLKTLRECLEGKADGSKPLNVRNCYENSPATVVPTKMTILSVAELPSKGFPRTLQHLQISNLRMCNFKRDILNLRYLKVLNLSNNVVERLPEEIGDLSHLVELNVSNNNLGQSKTKDWKWTTRKTISDHLKCLDLSNNNLMDIPNTISKLKSLVTLKLNNNNLKKLPCSLGKKLINLRFLFIAQNDLTHLPISLLSLRLEQIDVSSNPWQRYEATEKEFKFQINSLVDIAAAAVLKFNFHYASDVIPFTLVDHLDDAKYCICGSSTFNQLNRTTHNHSLKLICETVVTNGIHNVDFECHVCSYQCYKKYFSRKRKR